jgi:hypothetical protein
MHYPDITCEWQANGVYYLWNGCFLHVRLIMKLFLSLFLLLPFFALAQGVMNFNYSPNNWVNSPNNFNNSPNNFGATNGVYDNRGNRISYEVPAPSGVINYFVNSGNRIGYKPSNK